MNKLEYYDRQKDEWSTSETDQIISEYNTMTISQIADIHRRTPGSINYKLKNLKIITHTTLAKGYDEYRNSELYKEIIEKNDKERREKLPDEKNTGHTWTLQEDSQLISEYKSGINITEISNIHKRSIGGIKKRLRLINYSDKSPDLTSTNIKNIKELTQTINELKENIKELSGLLHSLYEFETA